MPNKNISTFNLIVRIVNLSRNVGEQCKAENAPVYEVSGTLAIRIQEGLENIDDVKKTLRGPSTFGETASTNIFGSNDDNFRQTLRFRYFGVLCG